jgi:hypothetical protein
LLSDGFQVDDAMLTRTTKYGRPVGWAHAAASWFFRIIPRHSDGCGHLYHVMFAVQIFGDSAWLAVNVLQMVSQEFVHDLGRSLLGRLGLCHKLLE